MTWKPSLRSRNGRLFHRYWLKKLCSRLEQPVLLLLGPPTKKKKTAEDYPKDRVNKYAPYFEKDRILPIPELVDAVEPKTRSFVISNFRTRRLAGLKKETFEELLKTAGVPSRYFCRRSFATWDFLLSSEDLAKKLAGDTITTKFSRR